MKKIEIEELRRIEIDVLDYFVEICTKNHLEYFLAFGTLLGAVRHKGFIPWDDDIDVCMPRNDYEKLKDLFPFHSYYKLIHHDNTRNYPVPFATLNDVRTLKDENNIRKSCNGIKCVNIDIFPVDNIPDNQLSIDKLYNEIAKRGNRLFCMTYSYGRSNTINKTIKRCLGIFIYRILELLKLDSIEKEVGNFDKLAQKYKKIKTSMCGVTSIYMYGSRQSHPKRDCYPVSKVVFEGKEYNAPSNPHNYLKQIYGDYMKLPPIEEQKTHHPSNCYWR